ncbi:radical SAM family heme chaperone HemW [Vagococcus xieshaowenii]|uniref:Heme chaperone HemW n=1 Tax=Vagococcus xieshaowenii TaxID=2562451 RepID=A0AAJ5JMD2_9ENTE|nr:radical SAM family heme chaperone HemW [Vagococcus xieshaowenii]QCA28773.1 oxygen-independent coproporphyrinogen III oxidase [Vagococcus xieshaowenii]TFZ43026.1 oxygen-independent coproporphyrinogen III oxidase [Vagococcus xieshaowenii]
MTSAYIHIPFCEHICYYCDFNKVMLEGQPVDEYVQALLKEIKMTLEKYPTDNTETIYIGGGTPTSLTAEQLDVLLSGIRELMPFQDGNEFTVEANPGDLTLEKLNVMSSYGVNRLSMGVQSFDDKLLKKIGRKHSAQDVYDTMKVIDKAGFGNNVSIDLIYALPGQTMASFEDTLKQALALDLPHYSLYSLILENQTIFYNWARQGRLELPPEDVEGNMFERAAEEMEKHGKKQYEISNFSAPGKQSQHNLVYWNNEHYYGLGAGASGYLNQTRYKNHGPIQHYLKPLRENQLPIREVEKLSTKNVMEEQMFLGLRKLAGISINEFNQKFDRDFYDVYGKVLPELEKQDLIQIKDDRIALTKHGLILGNEVFEKFLID